MNPTIDYVIRTLNIRLELMSAQLMREDHVGRRQRLEVEISATAFALSQYAAALCATEQAAVVS